MTEPSTATPKWTALVSLALACVGTTGILSGGLITYGGWRSTVDDKLTEHDKRLTVVETTQRANLPTFYKMQSDLGYLADQARRQETRDQERRR